MINNNNNVKKKKRSWSDEGRQNQPLKNKKLNGNTTSTVIENQSVLDKIVKKYLRTQHEQCPNPICVLPPFSLTEKHICRESIFTHKITNITKKIM